MSKQVTARILSANSALKLIPFFVDLMLLTDTSIAPISWATITIRAPTHCIFFASSHHTHRCNRLELRLLHPLWKPLHLLLGSTLNSLLNLPLIWRHHRLGSLHGWCEWYTTIWVLIGDWDYTEHRLHIFLLLWLHLSPLLLLLRRLLIRWVIVVLWLHLYFFI